MTRQPTLMTERLILRPFELCDAPDVQRLAGSREVAATTINIPHPYEDGVAEAWIASHPERFAKGEVVNYAICERKGGNLVGAITLFFQSEHQRAEIGYWIGKQYWGKGFCSEAAREVVRYGFEQRGLNRVHAHYLGNNPASGRVMEKIGMKCEGRLRHHMIKWGEPQDMIVYAILKSEYQAMQKAAE